MKGHIDQIRIQNKQNEEEKMNIWMKDNMKKNKKKGKKSNNNKK
jgi:hypothetical protein